MVRAMPDLPVLELLAIQVERVVLAALPLAQLVEMVIGLLVVVAAAAAV
jgi:hypothetical protein